MKNLHSIIYIDIFIKLDTELIHLLDTELIQLDTEIIQLDTKLIHF